MSNNDVLIYSIKGAGKSSIYSNMTKYLKSSPALPSKLHLWGSLPTQTAIKDVKRTDFYPLSSIDSSDTVNFHIPKTPLQLLDKVEIYTELRVLSATD